MRQVGEQPSFGAVPPSSHSSAQLPCTHAVAAGHRVARRMRRRCRRRGWYRWPGRRTRCRPARRRRAGSRPGCRCSCRRRHIGRRRGGTRRWPARRHQPDRRALAPSQFSATSHTPAVARQISVVGSKASAGHAAVEPVQLSETSHGPATARHSTVDGWRRRLAGGARTGAVFDDVADVGGAATLDGRRLEPVDRAGGGRARAVLGHVADAGRAAAGRRRAHERIGRDTPRSTPCSSRRRRRCRRRGGTPVALEDEGVGGTVVARRPCSSRRRIADARRGATDRRRGVESIRRAGGARARAVLGRVADAGGAATLRRRAREAVGRTIRGRARAGFLHVAHARRRAADLPARAEPARRRAARRPAAVRAAEVALLGAIQLANRHSWRCRTRGPRARGRPPRCRRLCRCAPVVPKYVFAGCQAPLPASLASIRTLTVMLPTAAPRRQSECTPGAVLTPPDPRMLSAGERLRRRVSHDRARAAERERHARVDERAVADHRALPGVADEGRAVRRPDEHFVAARLRAAVAVHACCRTASRCSG